MNTPLIHVRKPKVRVLDRTLLYYNNNSTTVVLGVRRSSAGRQAGSGVGGVPPPLRENIHTPLVFIG